MGVSSPAAAAAQTAPRPAGGNPSMFDRAGAVHGGCRAARRTGTARLVGLAGLRPALAAQQAAGLIESEPGIVKSLLLRFKRHSTHVG